MARISDGLFQDWEQLALYLDRYADLMGLEPCGFNGVNKPTTNYDNQCVAIVGQSQRDMLARHLLQAEQMREEELNYHLGAKWDSEQHEYYGHNPYDLKWKHLLEVGYPTQTLIEAGVALDHGTPPFTTDNPPTDPVVFTVTVDSSATTDEIHVYYPGEPDEQRRIYPSHISISGTTATIQIPRCRLVDPDYNDDRDDPISYYETDPFLTTVDVYWYYADVSLGAEFIWVREDCSDTDCEPSCQPACPMIVGPDAYKLSIVHVYPATYSGGSWTRATCWTYKSLPDFVRFAYKSGQTSTMDEIATIQLAHTLMPSPPCSCDIVLDKWASDNEVMPNTFSPYGSKRGQVEAWVKDSRRVLGNGGMILDTSLSKYPR